MVKKRMFIALSTAVAVVVALAGCTSNNSVNDGGNTTASSHLTKILKSKTIRIGVLTTAAPYSFKSPSGQYEGFDIDIANALATSLGAKADFVAVTDVSRIPAVQADRVDVVIAAMGIKDARAQQISFSTPYLMASTQIATRKDGKIKSYNDLDGTKVASTQGSQGSDALKTQFSKALPVEFASFADSAQAIKSKKVDSVISDNVTINALIQSDPSLELLAGPPINPGYTGMGVVTGDWVWLQYLNTFIRNYDISGPGHASYLKWIGQDMPASLG